MSETNFNGWRELVIKVQNDRQRLLDLMIAHFNEPCSVALKKYLEEKPEPKPDVVRYGCISSLNVEEINLTSCPCDFDNLKLTFDGETGILKSAEVIKNV